MNILEQGQEIDVRTEILLYLKKKGITKKHIAKNVLDCSVGHLSQILEGNRNLTQENLDKINKELNTQFILRQIEGMKIAG